MVSKSTGAVWCVTRLAITALSLILFASCSSVGPWRHEAPANEVNLAFTIQNNLIFLSTARINHQPGRILFGSAEPQTVVDSAFAGRLRTSRYELNLNERENLPLTPLTLDLKGVGDAIVGADVFLAHAVTIDYSSGLVTYQKDGIHPAYMTLFGYDAAPTILGEVDGRSIPLIVDTALPDSIVVPRGNAAAGRRMAHVVIAGTDFGNIDIAMSDVSAPRVGNRLLSKFLVSVDYGKREVGLWRDPRIH